MAGQLAYVIVTPYTIQKSRTGAILSRLLGRVSGELIAAQVVAPTRELAERYAASLGHAANAAEEFHRQLIRDYILRNCAPDSAGVRHRVLMLVFRGVNAYTDIANVVGHLRISCTSGETIRDTYGDLVWNDDGSVRYFEPAVLSAASEEAVTADLELWLEFARTQPALLENVCVYENPEKVQQTLVVIKPDSWRQRSSRPGAIMDMFSRTGLRVIGCKLCQLSVEQGLEFYGPVREVLCRKLAPGVGAKARAILERELGFRLPPEADKLLVDYVGVPFALQQFESIIEFMTGTKPSAAQGPEGNRGGKVKCLALVYEGEDAVGKIRDVLGPTDPTKAPDGTVRREFGSDVMVNTAHASDSPENARREMRILGMAEGNFVPIVSQALSEAGFPV